VATVLASQILCLQSEKENLEVIRMTKKARALRDRLEESAFVDMREFPLSDDFFRCIEYMMSLEYVDGIDELIWEQQLEYDRRHAFPTREELQRVRPSKRPPA
jgi:hypothetical protein